MSISTLPMGYVPPRELRKALTRFSKTNLPISIAAGIGDWVMILGCIGIFLLTGWSAGITPIMMLMAWALCTRSLRALEAILHEGVHYNLTRKRWLNDFTTDVLVGWPLLRPVSMFRRGHLDHHWGYGTDVDLGFKRFREVKMQSWPRTKPVWFLLTAITRFSDYSGDYWRPDSHAFRYIAWLFWHGTLLVAGTMAVGRDFLDAWCICFLIPFTVFLPIFRCIAESEEHTYVSTVVDSTFSNVGWTQRWILHPHGDAFHLLHHVLPSIPHHRIAAAHKFLLAHDKEYCKLNVRHKVFAELGKRSTSKSA